MQRKENNVSLASALHSCQSEYVASPLFPDTHPAFPAPQKAFQNISLLLDNYFTDILEWLIAWEEEVEIVPSFMKNL